jgi:DNA-damage-inducible protein D
MDTEERRPAPNGVSPFERIRRTNAAGAECWSSRDFAHVIRYSDYRNFEQAMKRAKTACFNSGQRIEDHFGEIAKMVTGSIKKPASRKGKRPEALADTPSEMDTMDASQ